MLFHLLPSKGRAQTQGPAQAGRTHRLDNSKAVPKRKEPGCSSTLERTDTGRGHFADPDSCGQGQGEAWGQRQLTGSCERERPGSCS